MNNFLKEWQESYKIDPALDKALKRLMETGKSAAADIELVSEAITPVKTFLQINSSASDVFKDLDWFAAYKNMFRPTAYSKSLESLTELQQAAFKRFSEGQAQLLKSMTEESQNIFKSPGSVDKPQQAIANYIDKSLDAFEDIKKELVEQSQNASTVNAAFMAWLQQTMQNFSAAEEA